MPLLHRGRRLVYSARETRIRGRYTSTDAERIHHVGKHVYIDRYVLHRILTGDARHMQCRRRSGTLLLHFNRFRMRLTNPTPVRMCRRRRLLSMDAGSYSNACRVFICPRRRWQRHLWTLIKRNIVKMNVDDTDVLTWNVRKDRVIDL